MHYHLGSHAENGKKQLAIYGESQELVFTHPDRQAVFQELEKLEGPLPEFIDLDFYKELELED